MRHETSHHRGRREPASKHPAAATLSFFSPAERFKEKDVTILHTPHNTSGFVTHEPSFLGRKEAALKRAAAAALQVLLLHRVSSPHHYSALKRSCSHKASLTLSTKCFALSNWGTFSALQKSAHIYLCLDATGPTFPQCCFTDIRRKSAGRADTATKLKSLILRLKRANEANGRSC